MAAKTLTLNEAKSANIDVIEEPRRGRQAVHDVIVAMQANRRSGTANTKTRSEVSATGRKPFRQKGTGRARQGGNAPPLHRGGGVALGPRPRDFSKKVNKATRRLALAKVLSERVAAGDVVTVPDFEIADGKTKSFIREVGQLAEGAERVLVLADVFSEETRRAARNHRPVLLASAREVNVEQLLRYDKVVVVGDALETLAERTTR